MTENEDDYDDTRKMQKFQHETNGRWRDICSAVKDAGTAG